MPIITPAYPSMCATHNVTRSNLEIINRELKRGGDITEKIMMSKAPWKDLFVKQTFFTQDYKYYLSIISASPTKEAQKLWSGAVESRVRHMVTKLEMHESVFLAHPFNKGFWRVHKCHTDEEVEKAKGGSLEYQVKDMENKATGEGGKESGDQTSNGDDKCTTVYTTTYYLGLELIEGKWPLSPLAVLAILQIFYVVTGTFEAPHGPASAAHLLMYLGAKSLDLTWQVSEFRNACTNWPKYDAELNALNVIHTRK
jgi:poly(A) polymerase